MMGILNCFRLKAKKRLLFLGFTLFVQISLILLVWGGLVVVHETRCVQRVEEHVNESSIPIKKTPTKEVSEQGGKQSARKPKPVGTVIDMVNDYQPYVDFKFVFPQIMPVVKGPRDHLLVVLVNSGAKGDEFRKRRQNIRRTWARQDTCEQHRALNNSRFKNLTWTVVFVIGKAGKGTDDDQRNAEEARLNNDMVIGDIEDNYLNNIVKFYMGQLWAMSTFNIKYTLKADDDVHLRVPGIVEYLANEGFPCRFYGGETYLNSGVMRWAGGKWSISKKYFAEDVWPPFNAGAFIILSKDLLSELFNYIHIRKPFHTDDAYIGVAMRDYKVKVTHILSFDIKNDMAKLIRQKNDCEILALVAYGHAVDPDSSRFLHERLESMCRSNKTRKDC